VPIERFNCVFLVHYFPPINSSGAKRFEYISKYLAKEGCEVTVITTRKTGSDGQFTEKYPEGIEVIELDFLGRSYPSKESDGVFVPMYSGKASYNRRLKDFVMNILGQVPDPRLPFALSFLKPKLESNVALALSTADVVIGTTPPWPMILAAVILKKRYGVPCILDYRDHFSECHEMPGGRLAKALEKVLDKWLVSKADYVVTISEPMKSYYENFTDSVSVIMNGYDLDTLERAREKATIQSSNNIVIRYMGIVSPGRIPYNFLKALRKLNQNKPSRFNKINLEYYGNASVLENFVRGNYPELLDRFSYFDFVPYELSLKLMIESDYLIFSETSSRATLSSQGILTTKLFEYIGSGRPIIADLSPDTLAASLIQSCGHAHLVSDSSEEIYNFISVDNFYKRKIDEVPETAHRYTRENQAKSYYELMRNTAKYES